MNLSSTDVGTWLARPGQPPLWARVLANRIMPETLSLCGHRISGSKPFAEDSTAAAKRAPRQILWKRPAPPTRRVSQQTDGSEHTHRGVWSDLNPPVWEGALHGFCEHSLPGHPETRQWADIRKTTYRSEFRDSDNRPTTTFWETIRYLPKTTVCGRRDWWWDSDQESIPPAPPVPHHRRLIA
jgi:hypothetical protein